MRPSAGIGVGMNRSVSVSEPCERDCRRVVASYKHPFAGDCDRLSSAPIAAERRILGLSVLQRRLALLFALALATNQEEK